MNPRLSSILEYLATHAKAAVNELARELKVSTVTIRQDLSFLEGQDLIKRVHGGAVIHETDNLSSRLIVNYSVKARISRKAASFVQEGDTILIESGSVNALIARELAGRRRLTIITTNVYIAHQLRSAGNLDVIILGGLYQQVSESLVGKLTRLCLDQVNFSKAFIGIDGFTPQEGFTSRDMMRAEISAYIVQRSERVYIVSDSTKFGKVDLSKICGLEEVDRVITDAGIPADCRKAIEDAGVELIIV